MQLTPSELRMWEKEVSSSLSKMSDEEINAKYLRREWRISQPAKAGAELLRLHLPSNFDAFVGDGI